ncbi:hypothetical protein ACRQ5D_01065 [Mucilaginibacter sp. P25]|uniref:hypothetical protein n=1 Tax=Mucilaginibacter TaxID=423349 RepID=UPI000B8036D1|nr:hypothetical protein [Mucilaginibacter gossypii]
MDGAAIAPGHRQKILRIPAQKTIGKTDHKNGVATLSVCKTGKAAIWFFLKKILKISKNYTFKCRRFNLSKKSILNSL